MSDAAASGPLLAIRNIDKHFGGVAALSDVSFYLRRGTIAGLIGPNGSGKTTLLNVLNGVYRADRGAVEFDGLALGARRPSELASLGITRTFQSARVFSTLTVLQNLFVPLLHHAAAERTAASADAAELLAFVGLAEFASHTASELSGGQKRLLEFARALVTRPRLILMDEPFAGVHPLIKTTLIGCIKETVKRQAASFLIVSHEVPDLVGMADAMVCLVEGRVAAAGKPGEVLADERVIEGYLGRAHA
jgi:ABC-type branched-subunit amino acid transport system ATPase component